MKIFFTAIVSISFVGISVFAFFAMGHDGSDHISCIARTLQGRACAETSVFGVASYHLSAFQKASRAIAASFGFLAALAALAVLILVGVINLNLPPAFNSPVRIPVIADGASFNAPQKIFLRHWLSLKENSPNF